MTRQEKPSARESLVTVSKNLPFATYAPMLQMAQDRYRSFSRLLTKRAMVRFQSKLPFFHKTFLIVKVSYFSSKDLHKALDDAKILKEDLRKSREKTQEISKKFEAVKTGYRIIFKQYAMTFKDDPEQLTMLEELNSIINE